MKRKINEAFEQPIVVIASKIRKDDASVDCNELKDILVDAGAEVEGEYKDGETHMIVTGISKDQVVSILDEFLMDSNCMFAKDYILEDILKEAELAEDELAEDELAEDELAEDELAEDELAEDELAESVDFPAWDDVNINEGLGRFLSFEKDADDEGKVYGRHSDEFRKIARAHGLEEAEEVDALEELQLELEAARNAGFDGVNFDDEVALDSVIADENVVVYSISCDGIMDTNIGDVDIEELEDEDDLYTLIDVVKDLVADAKAEDAADFPDYDEVELPRMEKMHRRGRLEEKKKGCCPKKPSVNEAEIVLNDLRKTVEVNESFSEIISDIDNKMLEEKTLKALKANKECLHENVKVNGKSLKDYSLEELHVLFTKLEESKETLTNKIKNSLNESVDQTLKDSLSKRNQLLEYVDEEITYRETRAKYVKVETLNEDGAVISDEELANLFGPGQGEEEEPKKEEGSEESTEGEDETVELSRIEITLKDADALKDLKDACVEAGIPEEAFECEGLKDDEESDEESDEDAFEEEPAEEETSEEGEESEAETEQPNESVQYHNIMSLITEGEVPAEEPADEEAPAEGDEESEESTEGDEAEGESDEESEEPADEFKFILTDTDHAATLAKVLDDVYGITKDEFEEMIGGEIVEEDADESESEGDSEESEKSEEKKDDEAEGEEKAEGEEDEEKKDDEDDIDPSELFKGL